MADVEKDYSKRAAEYVEHLGSLEHMDPPDVGSITRWGLSVDGTILDAGSGPGHWTEHLRGHGCDVIGIDIVPTFVNSARLRFPLANFTTGDLLSTRFEDHHFSEILAWYSLIHMNPEQRFMAFTEFSRVLKLGGTVLIGLFLGQHNTPFDHAVTKAFYCSPDELTQELAAAGFQTISVDTRFPQTTRPHLSMLARLGC